MLSKYCNGNHILWPKTIKSFFPGPQWPERKANKLEWNSTQKSFSVTCYSCYGGVLLPFKKKNSFEASITMSKHIWITNDWPSPRSLASWFCAITSPILDWKKAKLLWKCGRKKITCISCAHIYINVNSHWFAFMIDAQKFVLINSYLLWFIQKIKWIHHL